MKITKKKIGRNDPCPCGSGKKYKKCCIGKILDNQFNSSSSTTIKQLFEMIKLGLSQETAVSDNSKKIRIKDIQLVNNSVLLCEFYPYSDSTVELKNEISYIISFISSFCKDNPHVHDYIQNFAVRAFTENNDEIMYALSSKKTAEYISQGKPIEWLKNTIFQENTKDFRLSNAKRKISEIENALRQLIVKILADKHGPQWWDVSVNNKVKEQAGDIYIARKGISSSDGNELIYCTYILHLRAIITSNWDAFKNVFPDKIKFDNSINDFNIVRS